MAGGRVSAEELEAMLAEGGERDRLKELLRQRLKDSGWTRMVSERCAAVVAERGGVEALNAADLVDEVTPFARKQVPNEVKQELLQLIRDFLTAKTGIDDF